MKRVLVTGGGGFVGSHLAEGYSRAGHRVTVIDASFDAPTAARLGRCDCVTAALTTASLAALKGSFDLVIHAAAITTSRGPIGQADVQHLRTNLDLLLDALGHAQRGEASSFVFVSSSGVFAAGDADDVLLESTRPTGRCSYALAKRLGEEIVAAADGAGLRTLSIRLGYIYGPHERVRPSRVDVSLVRRWLDCLENGEPIIVETPGLRRDWTYAGDLAAAVETALALERGAPLLHLGSGAIVTDLELARTMIAVAGRGEIHYEPKGAPAPAKAPMSSLEPLKINWTDLTDGLAATLAARVAA
jgi:UDP-glucose 4-epimerase